MSERHEHSDTTPRTSPRTAILVACAAVTALVLSACNAGDGGSGTNAGGHGPNTASESCGRPSTNPYPGLPAAQAPGVTAGKNARIPVGKPGRDKPKITIGTKDFAESLLLGQLYKTALQEKGFTVELKTDIGPSEEIDEAFQDGEIDMYPEYLGEIVTSIAGKKPQDSAGATYEAAKSFEEEHRDATILQQTPYQNVDILLVKPEFCRKNHLESANDLAHVGTNGSKVVFAAQQAAKNRYSGFKGLRKAYGLTEAEFHGVSAGGEALTAVNNGKANVADGFSTTTSVVQAVQDGEFVALKDPKHIMGFQHVAPVVKLPVLTEQGNKFADTLNWVNSKLKLEVINKLNKKVQSKGIPAEQVAKEYLGSNGL